jgi:hypothetical protein
MKPRILPGYVLEVRRCLITECVNGSQFETIGYARTRDTQQHDKAMLLRFKVGHCSTSRRKCTRSEGKAIL